MSNDWKNYEKKPTKDLFGGIMHKLKVRRMVRIGSVMAAAAIVVAAVAVAANRHTASLPENAPAIIAETEESLQVATADAEGCNAREKTPAESSERRAIATGPAAQPAYSLVGLAETEEKPQVAMADTSLYAATGEQAVESRQPVADGSYRNSHDEESETREEEATVDPYIPASPIPQPAQTEDEAPKTGLPEPEPYHENNLIWAPNIIAPNSEEERVRQFSVVINNEVSDFTIHIYNRRGQRVYSSSDQQFRWDATSGGSAVQQGAYVWVATFRDSNGNKRSERGTVTVVR